MAQTSTLTVKLTGEPLVGAEVITSVDIVVQTTDGDGKISASLPDNYVACVFVAVRHSSIPNVTHVSLCILEAGEDYEINIPSDVGESGSEDMGMRLYGIHSRFITKL